MPPVAVKVVAYTPTEFFHCMHCELLWHEAGIGQRFHAEQRESALPPDLADEYARLGAWIQDIDSRMGTRLTIDVIDAVSLEGFFTILRHRLGRLPAVVVDGRVFRGDQLEAVEETLQQQLALA